MTPATLMFRSRVWAAQQRRKVRARKALAWDMAALTRTKILPNKAIYVGVERSRDTEKREEDKRIEFEEAAATLKAFQQQKKKQDDKHQHG